MTQFTEEQLVELETIFNLKRSNEETLPVRDGVVTKKSMVWWRAVRAPEHVCANSSDHWYNIRNHPRVYQLAKPETKTVYVD